MHWARGRRELGRISDAAAQGCHQIWGTVTDLWRAEEQAAGRQRRGVAARRRGRRELLREEADLMGHEVENLHPVEGQT